MSDLSKRDMETLYFNFCDYRDRICDGWARIGIQAFYDKYRLDRHE